MCVPIGLLEVACFLLWEEGGRGEILLYEDSKKEYLNVFSFKNRLKLSSMLEPLRIELSCLIFILFI